MPAKIDPTRKEEIDESIEKGNAFTILSGEEAQYAIAKVAGFIEEQDILSSFLPRGRKSLERKREAKTELMKIFKRQLRMAKVYPRTSRDNMIAFIGGYVVACSK